MQHPFSALWKALSRRSPKLDPSNPWIGSPDLRHDDTDAQAAPATGYPHHYFPALHPLPTGEPNRADELLWVDTEIARHAAAGTLDEYSLHVLDAQIEARKQQWLQAVDAASARRDHTIRGLIATETHYATYADLILAATRRQLATAEAENAHWRKYLTGSTEPAPPPHGVHPDNHHAPSWTNPKPPRPTDPTDGGAS